MAEFAALIAQTVSAPRDDLTAVAARSVESLRHSGSVSPFKQQTDYITNNRQTAYLVNGRNPAAIGVPRLGRRDVPVIVGDELDGSRIEPSRTTLLDVPLGVLN
jgi:hypothetical protein